MHKELTIVRVLSFNILEGGVDIRGNRIGLILELLKQLSPDIVALQEANRFSRGEDNHLQTFSNQLALPFTALSCGALYEDGQRYHVATISRYPISSSYCFPDATLQSAALRTTIESPLGVLSMTNMHLHAYSEDARIKELEQILAVKDESQLQVLLGDFNSISRADNYSEKTLDCEERYEIIDTLSESYIDVALLKNSNAFTHPTELGDPNPRYTNPRRIDYCFVSPTLSNKVSNFNTIAGGLAEQTSDHRPILIEFC